MTITIDTKNAIQFQPHDIKRNPLPMREALPVTVEGFDGIEFLMFKMDGLWAMCEKSTLLYITRGHGSKFEARDKASYLLGIQGVEKTRLAISRALERTA